MPSQPHQSKSQNIPRLTGMWLGGRGGGTLPSSPQIYFESHKAGKRERQQGEKIPRPSCIRRQKSPAFCVFGTCGRLFQASVSLCACCPRMEIRGSHDDKATGKPVGGRGPRGGASGCAHLEGSALHLTQNSVSATGQLRNLIFPFLKAQLIPSFLGSGLQRTPKKETIRTRPDAKQSH